MLQYLVDDYLEGCGLPQLRKVVGALRLGVNEKGDRCLVNMLDNKPIDLSFTEVVAVRLYHMPLSGGGTGSLTYLLFSDMTECWMCGDRQLRVSVSADTLQLYLESSE
jgi:hypothetical protein